MLGRRGMDDYAAAMTFLDEETDVAGIDMQKDSRCQVCCLQWHLTNLGQIEEPTFSPDLTELLGSLRNECSRRKVRWNNILAAVQHTDVPGPVTISDHQEQQDLQYTLADGDDQIHNLRTDRIDPKVSRRPRPPISRSLHLMEGITHICHPDTNTVKYSHHDLTGSPHDNHSPTSMVNPITNRIQDQDNGVQYPVFHDIQAPSYSNLMGSADVNYAAYGQAWVPYDQTMLQDLETLQTQIPDGRSTPLSISDLMNPTVKNDMFSQSRDPGATMAQDDPAAVSVRQNTVSDKADLSRDGMMKEIKTFFTESFERLGVELHGTKRNKKLPWLQFDDTLKDEGIEMVNWPEDVPTPGKGSNSSKGLAGVPVRDLKRIHKAIHSNPGKLELRHIPGARKSGQAVSQQEFFAESSATGSRKRLRDAGDTDGDSRPKKRLVFKNIRFDGVMEAWKVHLHWFLELSLTLYRTD
ncbi:hypothetical protein C8J56DRAFT_1165470 [Mycena floridula]|nr:hypothetical protein C8J56DRAFT_1165470 [Mycena floridula]